MGLTDLTLSEKKQKKQYYKMLANLANKSYMLDSFLISIVYYKCSYKL